MYHKDNQQFQPQASWPLAIQYFNLGCHGHTVFGVAVRWKLAFSKPHGHVEDSMTVAPLSRQLIQLNGPAPWPKRECRTVISRRGFTLTEMIATFVLLGAAITMAAPLLVSVARQRVAIEQRQFAIQYAGNLLERHVARPWDDLSAGQQMLTDVPPDLQRLLPDVEQSLTVKELPEQPASRQLTVSVRWRGQAGVTVNPVQLSAWVFQPEEL